MLERREKYISNIICLFFAVAVFVFLNALFIRYKYGELILATADNGFLRLFENKRRLYLLEVCIPTIFIWGLVETFRIFFLRKITSKTRRVVMMSAIAVSILALIMSGCLLKVGDYVKRQIQLSQTHWYDNNKVVIHALGEVDGHTYTNSLEALENSFSMGNRVFECDFALTSDDKMVACHDWNVDFLEEFSEENVPTKEEFMRVKIYGKYTPMSIDEILVFMKENPDVYMITDTKYAESEYYEKQFKEIVDASVKNNCEEVLNNFIIQIYHPYMHEDIEKIYHFDNYIYTLYQEGYRGDPQQFEEYAQFCALHDIDVITMNEEYYSDELLDICNRYRLQLFVHTVNDEIKQKFFLGKNIGIYTDKYRQ